MNSEQRTTCQDKDGFWELLPWFLNGSLAPAEHERMSAHMAMCETCRAEVTAQQELATLVMTSSMNVPEMENAYDEIDARINKSSRRQRPRLRFLDALRKRGLNEFKLPGFPSSAVLVAVSVCIVMLVNNTERNQFPSARPGDFRTLTSTENATESTHHARVVFSGEFNAETVTATFADINATIVSGPSKQGVYAISIGDESTTDQEILTAIAMLRRDEKIKFAEPTSTFSGLKPQL